MLGFGKAKLRGALEASRAIGKALGDRVTELAAEAAEKDEKIARLDTECDNLALRINEYKAAEAKHFQAMAKQVRETEDAQRDLDVAQKAVASLVKERDQARADAAEAERARRVLDRSLNEALLGRDAARETLRKIADMPTPGAAPIGKRLARVAAEHLAAVAVVQAEAA